MTIKVGDKLPSGTLQEYNETETPGCPVGPTPVAVDELTTNKKVVIFGLPGAFTPTCSAKHVPSYVAHFDELKAKGVDEIVCVSVNDAFVMGAWARDQKSGGKVRMLGDGSGAWTKALGLEQDLKARRYGKRDGGRNRPPSRFARRACAFRSRRAGAATRARRRRAARRGR